MWRTCDEAVLSFGGSHLDTSISLNGYTQTCHWSILTLKSAAYGRTRDGRRNYVHFVTAYDIHFIVNNKYYAMNTGKVRNLPIFSKKFPAFGAIIQTTGLIIYRIIYRIIYLSTYNTRCRYSGGFVALVAIIKTLSFHIKLGWALSTI